MATIAGRQLRMVVAMALSLASAGAAWAQEPALEGDRAELQVLKARLERLEQRIADGEAAVSTGDKPGLPTLVLPSGLSGLQMSGYADVSFMYNFAESDGGAGRVTRGRTFDTEPSGFTPHAFELVLEKPESDELPIGFRTDLFIGDDAPVIGATGLGLGTAGDEFELQQVYLTAQAPVGEGIDFKVGKFVTLLGAEVIESPANWNFSRSYLFGYAIPFTHTGALVSYPLGELGSITGGVVNGWDVVDDNNKAKTLLGNITLTPAEGLSLLASAITGAEQTANNRDDRSVLDLVASWQATEALAFMANYDYGHESGLAPNGANWQGLALYTKYNLTPTWSLAGRWEWFDDQDNVRTALTGPGGAAPADIDFYEWTLTSQWMLHKHVIARLEYRHDKADERVFFKDADGFTNYQDTIAAEMIYHF